MSKLLRWSTALALCALPLSSIVQAEEAHYNQISLQAEVSRKVEHDLMYVTFYQEQEGTDPAKLADSITQVLNAAIEKARQVQGVTISLGSRNNYPVYDKEGQQITRWRERGELLLESADFAKLSQLTSELMKDLRMDNMRFGIANETRKRNEDELMKEAVLAFQARAKLLAEALNSNQYKLVNLSLNTSHSPMPIPRAVMMADSKSAGYGSTPQIEGGSSQVTIFANGTIEVAP